MKARSVLSLSAALLLATGAAVAARQSEAAEKAMVKQAAVSLPPNRPLISIALENRAGLVLSDQQVRKLRALRSRFRKGEIRRGADLRIREIELDELLAGEPLDLSPVEAKVKGIEALRAEGRLSLIRTLQEGKALLSDEQKRKLASLLQKSRKEHRRSHGRSGMGMGMSGMMMGMRGCPMMAAAMGGMGHMGGGMGHMMGGMEGRGGMKGMRGKKGMEGMEGMEPTKGMRKMESPAGMEMGK